MSTPQIRSRELLSAAQSIIEALSSDPTLDQIKGRFWAKVNFNGPIPQNRPNLGNCWLWKGKPSHYGYGKFFIHRISIGAHRVALTLCGRLPSSNLVPDHLCRNGMCVNPKHIEETTHRVNILRGTGVAAINASLTYCRKGHPLKGDNLHVYSGKRVCRQCKREDMRDRRAHAHASTKK